MDISDSVDVTAESCVLEDAVGKRSRSRAANRNKKLKLFRWKGVEGLIQKNVESRARRQENHMRKSQGYVLCAFECAGLRKGLVKDGKVSLSASGNQMKKDERSIGEGSSEIHCTEDRKSKVSSTFEVDTADCV